ncbi:hypothetical protein CRG98_008301 [Punica granatum]|uniref:Uncharacterized protein n=1 Tax=Punica granatum TaxID=22663 RepID=A0A2I0KS53_PUNGR|nr:hypothetical protein CRG98_008301 [Punica granatum]
MEGRRGDWGNQRVRIGGDAVVGGGGDRNGDGRRESGWSGKEPEGERGRLQREVAGFLISCLGWR